MNSFVWLFASDIARMNRNPFYFSSIIATFLLGASVGSAIYITLSGILPSINITFIGLLPILGVLVFTQTIPVNLKNDMENFESQSLNILTRREKEIFLMLLENMKNKDIAQSLNISPNTLKKHCGNIYRKLDVENKTELIKVYGYMKNAK
ncbi:MAG TPA: helix-turn-helix transcriptional regulator [Clostridia bacterium]|nr:helix-turn-helix transcriptional regulator [Clostridia bacterium]